MQRLGLQVQAQIHALVQQVRAGTGAGTGAHCC